MNIDAITRESYKKRYTSKQIAKLDSLSWSYLKGHIRFNFNGLDGYTYHVSINKEHVDKVIANYIKDYGNE